MVVWLAPCWPPRAEGWAKWSRDGGRWESEEGGGACVTGEGGDTWFILAKGDSDSLAARGVV